MGDIFRSLLVILIPLVIITVVFTRVPRDAPVKVVDWQPVLITARAEAPFPVLAPVNLPQDWRATRVSWVQQGKPFLNGQPSPRNFWQVGFLTPDDMYIGLSQGDQQVADLIKAETRDGVADGESVLGTTTWVRMVSPDERTRSLVLTQPKVTTIVSGDLPYEALDSYATTLSTTG